jgi:hypothetical protein
MTEDIPPKPPDLLPNYLVDGIGNQDLETLSAMREYIDELIEWMDQPVEDDGLPDKADPVKDDDDGRRGTVVMEKVTCGDGTCKCMKKSSVDRWMAKGWGGWMTLLASLSADST